MGAGVRLERHLGSNGAVDFLGGYFPFFYDTVRQNDCGPTVEKVQHSIVDALVACPQLIDSVPKVICLGTPELVAQSSSRLSLARHFCWAFGGSSSSHSIKGGVLSAASWKKMTWVVGNRHLLYVRTIANTCQSLNGRLGLQV